MADDNATEFAIKSDDCLENRLNRASAEESRILLEEFLRAFCLDTPGIAVAGSSALAHPEFEKVTIKGHMTE